MFDDEIINELKKQANEEKEKLFTTSTVTITSVDGDTTEIKISNGNSNINEKVNRDENNKITDLEEIKFLKQLAVKEQKWELAAYFRDRERTLLSERDNKNQ